MFPDVILFSIVVALLRGARVADVSAIRHAWLLAAAVTLQILTNVWPSTGPLLVISSYALLTAMGVVNWHSLGFRLVTIGTVLNGLVFALNGGSMPVVAPTGFYTTELHAAEPGWTPYFPATAATPLAFLGDIIFLRYPLPRVISVGDVLVVAGVFLLTQELLGKPLTLFGPAEVSAEGGD